MFTRQKWWMSLFAVGCFFMNFAGAETNTTPCTDMPVALDAIGYQLSFEIDPAQEHIYGVEFELKGDTNTSVHIGRFQTYRADGSLFQDVPYQDLFGLFLIEMDGSWRKGRAEALTRKDSKRFLLRLSVTGRQDVQIRNVKLVEGGFPDNPPIPGTVYLKWIESLRANAEYARLNPLIKPGENFKSRPTDKEIPLREKEVASYLELPIEKLAALAPAQSPGSNNKIHWPSACWDTKNLYQPWTPWRWDPREPDILKQADGSLFDVAAEYPVTGEEDVQTPSGKTVKYAYYDPPGTVSSGPTRLAEGMVDFPGKWIAFGPFKKDDPAPDKKVLNSIPSELIIGGRKEQSREIVFNDNHQIDLGDVFGGKEMGKTVYVFAAIDSDKDTTITMGAGCDWWMQWWVNGECVYDNTQAGSGNILCPPSWTDHVLNVNLRKGRNIIAARAISGSGSFVFAAAGPAMLRRALNQGRLLFNPPKGRVYLNRFMPAVRVAEMARAGYTFAVLYHKTGKPEYALRSAALLYSIMRTIPDWPIFGWDGDHNRFFKPDDYQWHAFIMNDTYGAPNNCRYSHSGIRMMWVFAYQYDLLREAPVWEELSKKLGTDARKTAEDGILHAARMILKSDAKNRPIPSYLYHNMNPFGLETMIQIGRALGCPELVHYGVNKAEVLFRLLFMADGMFPESVSYHQQMVGSLSQLFELAGGYSDPPDYKALYDGKHIENYDAKREFPLFDRAMNLMTNRFYFPNGDLVTFHDTWAASSTPARRGPERSPAESWLLPDFGHAVIGWGLKPNQLEAHLHYSGAYNHGHNDMLNLTLWAYGDELASDIGYTHQNTYCYLTMFHNLVVVDGQNQGGTHRGDLMLWQAETGSVQVAGAQDIQAYKQTQCYQRTIIGIPAGSGQDAIVDIFEVSGGARHEWMANGCADYDQTLETDAPLLKEIATLAEDGHLLDKEDFLKTKMQYGSLYGAFRKVRLCDNSKPWTAVFKPGSPVAEGTPGAAPRAVSKEPKPGLRLHWLNPSGGQAFFCMAPRNRYWMETEYLYHQEEAKSTWGSRLMPKVIVRREGTNLNSTFVAVWEPFLKAPWIRSVSLSNEIDPALGMGITIEGEGNWAKVLYRKQDQPAELKINNFFGDGRVMVWRKAGEWTSLDLVEGSRVSADKMTAVVSRPGDMPVIGQGTENGIPWLRVQGILNGYPVDFVKQPLAGRNVRLIQAGQVSWWLPVTGIKAESNTTSRLFFSREIGFTYDPDRKILREENQPCRTLPGAASIHWPSGLTWQWRVPDKGVMEMKLRATGNVRLSLAGVAKVGTVKVKSALQKDPIEIPGRCEGETLVIEIDVGIMGNGEAELRLEGLETVVGKIQ